MTIDQGTWKLCFFQFQYSENIGNLKSLWLFDQEQQQNITFRCTGQQATKILSDPGVFQEALPYSFITIQQQCIHVWCVHCICHTLWLTTHSDIHFIIILISTHEQSCYCPHFRLVIAPQKTINWFSPPGPIWNRSWVRHLNLGLLTTSFTFWLYIP